MLVSALTAARDLLPHVADARARAAVGALGAAAIPSLAGSQRSRLGRVEAARADLYRDTTPHRDIGGRTLLLGEWAERASKSPSWGRALHAFVARTKPRAVLEIGTAVGLSAAAMGSALPPGGRLWTVEMHEPSARVAQRLFTDLDVPVELVVGRFEDVQESLLVKMAPIDLVFMDGNHHEDPTMQYLDWVTPHLSPDAVVILDDIRWSDEMRSTWEKVRRQERWAFTADLRTLGLCAL